MKTLKLTITTITLITLTACNSSNGKGKQNSAHGLINVPPIAQSQTIKLNEDKKASITLKATDEDIAGPDKDNNGIRDDVDDYIDSHYTDVKRRKAAQQLARMYQEMLTVDKSDKDKVAEVSKKGMLAISCAVNNNIYLREIKPLVLNTKKRVKEFYKYDSLRDGTTTTLPEGDTCEK